MDSLIQAKTFGLSIRTAQLEYAHGFGALSILDQIPTTKLSLIKSGAPESCILMKGNFVTESQSIEIQRSLISNMFLKDH